MKKFTNPLAGIKVASPCPADWNEMIGDDRRRYCAECKLNVYNLSEMTAREAENFIIRAEGRVCVKFYRRADGSVLTKDCPVGWAAVRKRVSLAAKAFVSICAGVFGGVFAFTAFQPRPEIVGQVETKVSAIDRSIPPNKIEDFDQMDAKAEIDEIPNNYEATVGMMILPLEKPSKNKKNRR